MSEWETRNRASGDTKQVLIWATGELPVSRLILPDGVDVPVKFVNYGLSLALDYLDLTLLLEPGNTTPVSSEALGAVQAIELVRDVQLSHVENVAFNNANARIKVLRLRFVDGRDDIDFHPFEFEFRTDRLIFRKQN